MSTATASAAQVGRLYAKRMQIEHTFGHEAPDPDIKRLSLLERVDQGKARVR